MQTYVKQLNADIARIEGEHERDYVSLYGAALALARFYAVSADFEAAKNQLVASDPVKCAALMANAEPRPLADALYLLANSLHSDVFDWQDTISKIECAGDAAWKEGLAYQRMLEDAAEAV